VLEILELAESLSKPEPEASLTDLRKSFGLSMTDLAERVGCSASYISALESGRVDNPGVRDREVLKRLASQLSNEVHQLTLHELMLAIKAQKRAS